MISRQTLLVSNKAFGFERAGNVIQPVEFERLTEHSIGSAKSFNPIASCLADQMSARQVQIAKSLAKNTCLDELALTLFDCDFSELSKFAAERLITYLRTTASEIRTSLDIRMAG